MYEYKCGEEAMHTHLQADVGVLHALLRQAGDAEGLTVVLQIELTHGSGLGSADVEV